MTKTTGRVLLKPGRDLSLKRRHPWIFDGAVDKIEGAPNSGETVGVFAADGSWMASGALSPSSQIRIRIWSFDSDEDIAPQFFKRRIERAAENRRLLGVQESGSAYRLVNAESDGLPGIVVDRYGDYLVCQFLSAGADRWKGTVVEQLKHLVPDGGIYERSDASSRALEGLEASTGVLWGKPPPKYLEVREGSLRFLVDVYRGHKTGSYLDQRENRAFIAAHSKGADVLNCFAYTGGFGLYALKGGAARVTNIEISSASLDLLEENLKINGWARESSENIPGDVFALLRAYRNASRKFDMVILDPPKFAQSARQVKKAARGYKDINLIAFKLLNPGGLLLTFSCSGHIGPALFQKIVFDAALDAGREVQIIRRLDQAADHPVSLQFPEAHYLKGLFCRVW